MRKFFAVLVACLTFTLFLLLSLSFNAARCVGAVCKPAVQYINQPERFSLWDPTKQKALGKPGQK
jgi:hypothetical protein